jgi:cytochrome d ubiquinol oxidase subunit II
MEWAWTQEFLLPWIFMVLMGISILIYVVLDGYDLGVGILMGRADKPDQDTMIASIGPFWDANETWLVLGVGLLLVAFPVAHGIILTNLYLPVAIMLGGLILRGVAFDFRAKAKDKHQRLWNHCFVGGSLITTFSQGFMLGMYIIGFEYTVDTVAFAVLCGLGLIPAYSMLGAGWLVMKTEGALQKQAVRWARWCLWGTAAGMALVSITTPLVSPRIFEKWFSFPEFFMLLPIPLFAGIVVIALEVALRHLPRENDRFSWVPFAGTVGLFLLGFQGLAYSFYPYLVQDKITIWEAASAPESLMVILIGALIVLPAIFIYTGYAYYVFRGKVRELSYD